MRNRMSLNCLKCTASVYVLITIVQATKLRHDLEEVRPRIFKIIERGHRLILEKLEGEDYNEKGLVRFLENNADLEYRVKNILNKRLNSNNRGPKKRLVKRIVPHGRYSPDVQYDKGSGTFFKPLVRIHKTKKLTQGASKKDRTNIVLTDDAAIPKLSRLQNDLRDLRTISNKYHIEEEEKNQTAFVTECGHAIKHLIEIDEYIKHLKLPYLERKLRKIMHKHLQIINPEVEKMHREIIGIVGTTRLLRGGATPIELVHAKKMYIKSGEEHDPYSAKGSTVMPGMLMAPDGGQSAEEQPCPLFPHQPLWNYWTYKDTIHTDDCPQGLVRIGTVCSQYPPHKK